MSNKKVDTNIKDEIYLENKSSLSQFLMILYLSLWKLPFDYAINEEMMNSFNH